jgi:hypothetical protein
MNYRQPSRLPINNDPKPAKTEKVKVLIFDGTFKFGSQDFGKNEAAAIEARNQFYSNQNPKA